MRAEITTRVGILSENEKRLLYSTMAKSTLKHPLGGKEFIAEVDPSHLGIYDLRKAQAWIDVTHYVESELARFGKQALWLLYEDLLNGGHVKDLGQYFTPPHVAHFTLSGIRKDQTLILDPMAGHGVFLKIAGEMFPKAKIVGVELDELPLSAARLVIGKKTKPIVADVFDWALAQVTQDSTLEFDSIVGNPAYVSYQNLQAIGNFSNNKPREPLEYRTHLIRTLKEIAKTKGTAPEINKIFRDWSGYSDLSMYALILAWLLTKPGGQIAFVLTNHWMERNYGELLRVFFAAHGTVRGIITHRTGNWFPRAQIPTSVIIFTKGHVAERQKNKGVPYVEIWGEQTDNLSKYLDARVNADFWGWLDNVSESKTLGPLHVTFKQWLRPTALQNGAVRAPERHQLRLPSVLTGKKLLPPERTGWSAHQGLRTGCNEVFYVKKPTGAFAKNQFIAELTIGGKKVSIPLVIPSGLVRPAIQKLPSSSPGIVDKKIAETYLLDLKGKVLSEDQRVYLRYPWRWQEVWKPNDVEIIPESLASHIRKCSELPYEGKEKKRTAVKDLSAVRTNIFVPPTETQGKTPSAPRFWYQLPLQRRHFGEIIVPRVSSGPVRAYLVRDSGSIVVDANFITFVSEPWGILAETLWIWMNSNTFRIICETNGVPLGGGALKLEAALLSRIPVPYMILEKHKQELASVGRGLNKPLRDEEVIEIGREVDSILFDRDTARKNVATLRRLISQRLKSYRRL